MFPDYYNFVIMRRLAILLIIIICSCENEFYPFIPDSKPVPIIFGLIDTNDSIHTIRLTKTFCGSQDAYKLSKDTANFLYDSVKMIIECLDVKLNVIDSLIFHKTYFNTQSSGIFNSGKSWHYLSTDKFPQNNTFVRFRLKAWIYDNDITIISTNVYNYLPGDRVKVFSPSDKSKYISVYNQNVTMIEFTGFERCGVKIRFNYSEISKDKITVNSVEKFWYNTTGLTSLTPEKLYMFIKNSVPNKSDVDFRIFHCLDIFSFSAPDGLLFYNKLFDADKSFFSSLSFFETPYNNITNGYGLFYRYSKDSVTGLKFDQKTLDSLAYGYFTKELKFVPYQ